MTISSKATLIDIGRAAIGKPWTPIRTIWPFKDGWGVWNPMTNTLLEDGLETKEQAQEICDRQNKE